MRKIQKKRLSLLIFKKGRREKNEKKARKKNRNIFHFNDLKFAFRKQTIVVNCLKLKIIIQEFLFVNVTIL